LRSRGWWCRRSAAHLLRDGERRADRGAVWHSWVGLPRADRTGRLPATV